MLTTSQLSPGERLLIERRRAGETLHAAAARWGVTLYRFGRWERDQDPTDTPRVSIGRIQRHEKLLLLRRRAGLGVIALGRLANLSPWWVTQIEAGAAPPARLEQYWRENAV